ncbi:MAG TPA: D-2-hydroxyacid dehydrogenase [Methylomirabilota bacterium]
MAAGRPTAGCPIVLVYHPDPAEAKAYARLIRLPRGRSASIHVCSTEAEAAAVIAGADAVYAWKFPPPLYATARRLTWLQAMGAGVDWALVPELPPAVVVTRAPGVFGPWMSEYVLGWCAWVTQRMETYRAAQRERRWIDTVLPGRLRGTTLALVGVGDIGREIARVARALGMRVIGVSRSGRRVPGVARVYRPRALHRALAAADFVVVVVPLTSETRGLIDASALAAMRPGAWLLNIGRGAVVDEAALVQALAARRIGGAVLDVFPTEPLPPDHPLWRLDNAVITPHISGPSTAEEIAPVFNDNLARRLAGRPLRHVVDRRREY